MDCSVIHCVRGNEQETVLNLDQPLRANPSQFRGPIASGAAAARKESAYTPLSLALAVASVAICTDIRFPISGLNISLGEIVAAISVIVAAARFHPTKSGVALGGMFLVLLLAILVIMNDQGGSVTITAVRNIFLPIILLGFIYHARLSAREAFGTLSVFLVGVASCAALGLDQAIRGSPPAFSLYSLDGFVSFRLHEVMSWKFNLAQTIKIISWQKSLAFGMNLFSNNFGEMLVYGIAALLGMRAANRIHNTLFLFALALFLFALIASLSRTAWIGAAVLVFTYGFITSRKTTVRLAWASISVIGVLAASSIMAIVVGFDGGGTVRGRFHLNDIGLNLIMNSEPLTLLLGGGGARYWAFSGATSYPHSDAIYMVINFGIIGLLALAVALVCILLALSEAIRRPTSLASRGLAIGGLLAFVWLVLYGLTWASLSASNSVFMWCVIIGVALSVSLREREAAVRAV
ncbi:MAG: hypothetical protein ACI9LT_000130 [Pseudoalteromonas distincta]|jgi:hypothetical protein